MKSFIDEDWTGLTHRQIWFSIVAEIEEEQCRADGHQWVPAYYCSVCGLQSSEALAEMTKKLNKKNKKK